MIGGSRRTAVWDDMNPVARVSVFDRGVDLVPKESLDLESRASSRVAYRTGDMHAPALSGREALGAMVTEFAAAVNEGRAPRTDGRAGLRVLDILEAASQSLTFKGAVVPLRSGRQ
jgi:predicted dehydrogenase